jgi:hypothetical protein
VSLYLVKVGYHEYLLKNEKDAFAVVKAMAGAVEVREDRRYRKGKILVSGPVKAMVEILTPDVKIEAYREDEPLTLTNGEDVQ